MTSAGALYAGPACPHCEGPLEVSQIVSGRQSCPRCRRTFEAVRFDPPAPDLSVTPLGQAGPEGAHACAHHAGNAAATHCGRCGVFMCNLCRIEADGKTLCPACFERLSDEGALPSAIASYRDYGRLSALLALLGLVVIFVAPVAGPGSIYYGLKRLSQLAASKEEGGKGTVYAVMALAALETIAGIAVIVWLVRQ
jgi:uncharacterized Zn finger protein (UPF0148 family)